jgi:hypothetical protein
MLDMMMVALIGFSGVVNACAASDSYFPIKKAGVRGYGARIVDCEPHNRVEICNDEIRRVSRLCYRSGCMISDSPSLAAGSRRQKGGFLSAL